MTSDSAILPFKSADALHLHPIFMHASDFLFLLSFLLKYSFLSFALQGLVKIPSPPLKMVSQWDLFSTLIAVVDRQYYMDDKIV